MSSTSWCTMSSVGPAPTGRAEDASPLSTHSEVGGWKWIPLGDGSQWLPPRSTAALGGWP